MADRGLLWVGRSRADLSDFPEEARREAGYQLRRVQQGLMPTDWKPMQSVGEGVIEIRVRTGLEHRVLYIAKFREAIYVLHSFEKKTRQTRDADITLARTRLRELHALRRRSGGN